MRTFRFILLILITLASVGAAVLLTIDGNLSRIIGRTAFSSGERLFPYTREEMNEVSWMRINCVGDVAGNSAVSPTASGGAKNPGTTVWTLARRRPFSSTRIPPALWTRCLCTKLIPLP